MRVVRYRAGQMRRDAPATGYAIAGDLYRRMRSFMRSNGTPSSANCQGLFPLRFQVAILRDERRSSSGLELHPEIK